MKLQRLIDADHVFLGLDANDARTALQAVAERVAAEIALPTAEIVHALAERERLGSTSVGDGFAIPHCKLSGLKSIFIALARFTEAIEFGSSDGSGVRFFFVVLSPPDQPAAHLQVLSQIARVLKRTELRLELLQATNPGEVASTIERVAQAEGL